MKKTAIILSVVLFTAGCAKVLMPSQADADRGASKFPGLTVAQLDEGRTLFKQKCTQCHPAKKAASRDEEQWEKIVPQMAEKAKRKGKEEISSADQETILKYLITMSTASKK
jgi:hypothetical protein